jgi:chaperonin GroES
MALNIKPLSDRVVIEPAAAETKTASGIYIPETAKEKPQKGTVVAVGKGNKDHDMTVRLVMKCFMGNTPGQNLNWKERII